MKRKPKEKRHWRKEERKQQIENALAIKSMNGSSTATMRQIAHRLDMVPSDHIMSILWDMVDEGRLLADPVPYCNGWTSWHFRLPPDRLPELLADVYSPIA